MLFPTDERHTDLNERINKKQAKKRVTYKKTNFRKTWFL